MQLTTKEEIELFWNVSSKIFEGFGGWYFVGAFVAITTWMKWYLKIK